MILYNLIALTVLAVLQSQYRPYGICAPKSRSTSRPGVVFIDPL